MTGPLLVTGLPRSGTSWVGKMLEASGEVVYVNEPMNPQHPPGHSPGILDATVTHRFQYVCTDNEEPWVRAFTDTLALRYKPAAELRRNRGPYDLAKMGKYATSFTMGRLRGRRAMLDDPFAIFAAPWLVDRMGVDALVLVRDPVAFVGSWRKLGWTIHFHELLEQPLLMRDHLEPYRTQMQALVGSDDWLARTALLWRMTYGFVEQVREGRPSLRVRTYESLVEDPVPAFRQVYEDLGLTWGPKVEDRVVGGSTDQGRAERAHSWSLRGGISRTAFRPMDRDQALGTFRERLTDDEIARVRVLTDDVYARLR
jgi:hypothetical protein